MQPSQEGNPGWAQTGIQVAMSIQKVFEQSVSWNQTIFAGHFIQTAAGENMFFEADRRGKLFQMKVFCAAIDSIKFSWKLELSSRLFGRLKIFGFFLFRRWCRGGGISGSGESALTLKKIVMSSILMIFNKSPDFYHVTYFDMISKVI